MAEESFATLGDTLTKSLLTGDFSLYQSVMALPLRIVPRGGASYVLSDQAGLEKDFDLYCQALKTAGVTDLYRVVDAVRPAVAGSFRVSFTVHILSRAHRVTDPFPSEMLLVPTAQGLRIAEIVSSPEHIDWTLGRGSLGPGSGLI